MSKNSGVCVKMLHVFGDKLWEIEPSVCLQIPKDEGTVKLPSIDDFPALGASNKNQNKVAKSTAIEIASNIANEKPEVVEYNESAPINTKENDGDYTEANSTNIKIVHTENENNALSKNSEDEKLKNAFKVAIKKMGKNPPVPILCSNFYRCHILNADSSINIKQTSYKKLSKFLQEMSSENFLTVKEEAKGVEKITAFNVAHPEILNFTLSASETEESNAASNPDNLFLTEMKELYFVNDKTIKFFNTFNVGQNEGLEAVQIKKYAKEYIRNNKLQDPTNIHLLQVDDLIKETCQLSTEVKVIHFDNLVSLITSQMDRNYAMRKKNELKVGGKQSIIKMSLATRSGNKKVTLIDNLEMFGIRLPEFAQACKVGVAASTTIIRPEGAGNSRRGQLLVQGNQINFVHNLLTKTYSIPDKFISGLDLAKKERKNVKKK